MLKKTLLSAGLTSGVALGAVFLFYYHDKIMDNTLVDSLHSFFKMQKHSHVRITDSNHTTYEDKSPWTQDNHDEFQTRQAVLKRESLIPVIISNHEISYGKWHDPYTNKNFYSPKKVAIDHLVPMEEVDQSGGYDWSENDLLRYSNDLTKNPYTLIVVSKEIHKQKGNKDPAHWLPPNKKYRCTYLKHWMSVKESFHLTMDIKEARAIIAEFQKCTP